MGNVACGVLPGSEDDDLFAGELQLHRCDRPQRCILPPVTVSEALVQQAEALIRQKRDESVLDESIESSVDRSFNKSVISEATMSVATTTMTTRTQPMGNRQMCRKGQKRQRPPRIKGRGVLLDDTLTEDLERAVNALTTNGQVKTLFQVLDGCGAGSVEQEYASKLTVLHLAMDSKCTASYKVDLARLFPYDPVRATLYSGDEQPKLTPEAPISFGSALPPSTPIRTLVTNSILADLALTGSLGLVPRKSHLPLPSNRKRPDHYLVLLNRRSGAPLAVCSLRAGTTGPPVMRIYATKPRLYGQKKAADTRQLGLGWCPDNWSLFAWAEVVTEGRYPDPLRYSIYMASGSDGRFEELPSYRARHDENLESPLVRVIGRTERERNYAPCALVSLCRMEDSFDEDDIFLRLSISKGIDPALIVCFASFVDELLEKSMHLQNRMLSESLYRTSTRAGG